MILYLVRHGEKQMDKDFYNEKLRHQDNPLSENGIKESRNLINYFKDKLIENILVSEYIRTFQTATPLAETFNLNPIIDARVNELDIGIIENMNKKEIENSYPDIYSCITLRNKDFTFPHGESGQDVKNRQDLLLNDLITQNKNTIIFSHEGFISIFICNLLGLPVYDRYKFKLDFCGITEIEYDEKNKIFRFLGLNYHY